MTTTTPDTTPGFDVGHYLRILLRRRLVIGVTVVVVVAVAMAINLLQTPTYVGRAEIVFTSTPSPLNGTANVVSLDPARDIQTQITVLTSAPVRKLASDALRVAAAPNISATGVTNANAILVTATSTDPVEAARVANAYANAYIEYRKARTVSDLLDAEQLIQGRITDLQHQIDAVTSEINSARPANQANVQASLGPQRDALLAQQGSLKQQLDQSQLQSAFASTGAQLGSPATVPTAPSSSGPVTVAIEALAIGAVLGLSLGFLVDFLDDSIKSRDDVGSASAGLPVLGLIPAVPGWKGNKAGPRVVSLSEPTSASAEAYRAVRTAIDFIAMDRSLQVLQVTSPSAGEGKSTTAANLAVALGRGGRSVCVVGGDLRCPRIHAFFGMANERGWISVVHGELPLSTVLQPITDIPEACILPSGRPPANPSELLGSGRMQGLLTSLTARFEIVLIDSAPILPVTDATVLAGRVDGVIVVVNPGSTKKRALTRAMELLHQVEAPVIGVLLNCSDTNAGRDFDFGYGYRYGYGYGYGYGRRDTETSPSPKPGIPTQVPGGPNRNRRSDRSRVAPAKV